MEKYNYEVIIDKLQQTRVGNSVQKPEIVVIHHSAVVTEGEYNVIDRLNVYSREHMQRIGNGGLAYHIYIPRNEDNNIYVTRYFNAAQWHCSNGFFNGKSVGILMEGDFTKQTPTDTQLKKLKQLLDEINTLFDNKDLALLNPKDNSTSREGNGINIKGGLFYHNEVAEKGFATACCGGNLIPHIKEYREKQGNVQWVNNATSLPAAPPSTTDDCESRINFVAGNLNSRIQQLDSEKSQLQSDLDKDKTLINDLQQELDRLRSKPSTPIVTVSTQKGLENDIKTKFIDLWNKFPVWVRYLAPNLIALILPTVILMIQNFNPNVATLGIVGVIFASVKSLVIGYLKNLNKKFGEPNSTN